MKSHRSGWKGESRRHSLARKGIKTVPAMAMGKRQRFLKNDNAKRVFTGKVSEDILTHLLKYDQDYWFNHYYGYSGYHKEGDVWIAWDNSSGDCFVEEFYTKEYARKFATELGTTPDELHKQDVIHLFDEIMVEGKKEEIAYWKESVIIDELHKDINHYLKKNEIESLSSNDFKEIARILQSNRDSERDFNFESPKEEQSIITDNVISLIGTRFKDDRRFNLSGYWNTFS